MLAIADRERVAEPNATRPAAPAKIVEHAEAQHGNVRLDELDRAGDDRHRDDADGDRDETIGARAAGRPRAHGVRRYSTAGNGARAAAMHASRESR